MKFHKFEGGGSWRKFPFRFRGGGGVVDEVPQIQGGVVGALFAANFELLLTMINATFLTVNW